MKKVQHKKFPNLIGTIKTFSPLLKDEIGEIAVECKGTTYYYNSLDDLSEEWKDYEEPKEYWFINELGKVEKAPSDWLCNERESRKEIGNYFETKEEAEKAVEKLKALQRLKDKGFKFGGHDDRDRGQLGDIIIYAETKKQKIEDINAPSRWNMRIWDDDKKEWFCQSDQECLAYYGFDIRGGEVTVNQWLSKLSFSRHLIWEQSTGLKDKNGKEIYGGDIVEYDWYIVSGKPAYRVKEQVVFDDMGARVDNDRIRNCSNIEVIGNIHENPELLGGENV